MMNHDKPAIEAGTLESGTRILVQPDDGVLPLLQLISDAQHSVYIKQFTFTHPQLLQGRHRRAPRRPRRARDAQSAPFIGRPRQRRPFAELQAAGVKVEWANPAFAVTHEKSMVIDDRLALVATFNFAEKYLTETRDYGLVTDQPVEVAQIRDCFIADWERKPFHPRPGSALLWSNQNSRGMMSAFIDSARHTLDIQHPEVRRRDNTGAHRPGALPEAYVSVCCAAASTASAVGTCSTPSPRCACSATWTSRCASRRTTACTPS